MELKLQYKVIGLNVLVFFDSFVLFLIFWLFLYSLHLCFNIRVRWNLWSWEMFYRNYVLGNGCIDRIFDDLLKDNPNLREQRVARFLLVFEKSIRRLYFFEKTDEEKRGFLKGFVCVRSVFAQFQCAECPGNISQTVIP